MVSNVFQVDWIFIDTVIIILLFLLLLSVKLFKSTQRWRLSFSNEFLESYSFPESYAAGRSLNFKIKHCNFTRNLSLYKQYYKYPVIFILRNKFKSHLTKIITEGLSSYGFNVINLKLNIKLNSTSKTLNITRSEINTLTSLVLDYFTREGFITNSKYILLNFSNHFFLNTEILSYPNKIGFIQINPRVNKYNKTSLKDTFSNLFYHSQLFFIFSKRSFFIFKNKDLRRFKEIDKSITNKANLITLEKSTKSFKYYETILLGIIIDLIENKIMKSVSFL